ncbi:MAG: outer membrane beta-barrel protein [Kiritimatiellales bacterium]|nr:outer membrane beta-barrel protein [Kiritimatiellales bacterium]
MNRVIGVVVIGLSLLCATVHAAQERSIHVSNSVRVGYDDNVHHDGVGDSSTYITDILQISAKAVFSARTDLLVYYQPQITYRENATDNKNVMYHLFYAKLNHAISERVFLGVSDRFNFQGDDERIQSAIDDLAYWENNIQASLSFTLSSLSQLTVAGGYELRRWSDSTYAARQDYDEYFASANYQRELRPNTTYGYLGVNFADLEYDSSTRGGYEVITGYGGLGHNFTPNVNGSVNLGYSSSSIDGAYGSETTAPYFSGSLQYNPSARTTINGSLTHSLSTSENTVYNIQESTAANLGLRHEFTGRITGVAAVGYTLSQYEADSAVVGSAQMDNDEDYFRFSTRLSYQINRIHFVDVGYEYSTRDSDIYTDWDRNRYDIGWRFKL